MLDSKFFVIVCYRIASQFEPSGRPESAVYLSIGSNRKLFQNILLGFELKDKEKEMLTLSGRGRGGVEGWKWRELGRERFWVNARRACLL